MSQKILLTIVFQFTWGKERGKSTQGNLLCDSSRSIKDRRLEHDFLNIQFLPLEKVQYHIAYQW